MIRFDSVFFQYANSPVLENINLEISEGELVALIGLNGSGKTSLFKMMNGLLIPSSGRVFVDEMSTKEENLLWKIRKKVGMIFQNPESQIVGTTVEEDIAFGMENIGVPRDEMIKRVDQVLDFVKMKELKLVEPHRLSGGQKQLLCIASTLAMHPKYVVMDEPTSMIDPISRENILKTIVELHKLGKTVLFSTHILDEIVIAQRVIYLRKGRIVFDGSPIEVINSVKEEFGTSEFVEFQSVLHRHGVIEHLMDVEGLSERLVKLCQSSLKK